MVGWIDAGHRVVEIIKLAGVEIVIVFDRRKIRGSRCEAHILSCRVP